ncbi:MAG: hypothetical protein E7335_10960 [Clostridiales bacterium]|nr:hypothetical protein [Clostridiales bacterium]
MIENENKKLSEELSDEQLDQVSGGASQDMGWMDDGIPSHWAVTCANCGLQFFVRSNKDCPSCANKEVILTYNNNKPIYDSDRHGGY